MRKTLLCLTTAAILGGCSSDWDSGKVAGTPSALQQPSFVAHQKAELGRRASSAKLPDRGTLIAYDSSRQPVRQGAFTYHAIELSEAHALNAARQGGKVDIRTPAGQLMSFTYDRHVDHGDGNWTWVGRTAEGLDAVITFGPDSVAGRISQANTESLRLSYSKGRTLLVEADPSKLRHPGSGRPLDHDVAVVPKAALQAAIAAKQNASAETAKNVSAAGGPNNTVDVVLGYTPGLVTQFGGVNQTVTALTNRIELANQAFASSLVTPRVRLVHTIQVNYTDTNSNSIALDQLSGQTCGINSCSSVTIPAELQPLRNARDQFGGDLVSLVRPLQEPQHGGCGVAWLTGPNNTAIDNTDATFGYSIVSSGSDRNENDGFTYDCPNETLAHEMAHNMGQQHNPEDTGTSPPTAGTHTYSYGYREARTDGFYTIMAYPVASGNQFLIPYFGNPNVNHPGTGRATGTATADNARSLNQAMLLVAQFRNTVVPFTGQLKNDYDGDGRSDIHWRNVSTGRNDMWLMNGTSVKSFLNVYNEPNVSWTVVGAGDFNGDGFGDALWRNTTSGAVYVQLLQGGTTLGTSAFAPTVADQNWQIVAIGDFDGNGRSDIYWRNSSTGRNDLWLMNGPAIASSATVYIEPNQAWKVRGTGDFNGDGRADIFWRNDSTGRNYIQYMSGFSLIAGSNYAPDVADQAWQVVAIGDFDADGRSDLYWRNSQTGRNDMWLMNGTVLKGFATVYNEPNQSWQIVNSGDYNGDGYTDVLWRNSSTGDNYMMLMQGTVILGSSAMLPRVADLNWRMTGMRGSN
jgi:peptidyl-Asp metalloendopeptidase